MAPVWLLAVLASGCPDRCTKYLEVFPASLQVPVAAGANVTVEAYARVRDGEGKVLDENITWTTTAPGVTIAPASGRNVRVTLDVSTVREFVVTATGAGKADEMVVTVVAPAGDQALAMPGEIPAVVTILHNGAGCPPESTYVFVGSSNIGDRRQGCASSSQEVVAFTSYRPPMPWGGAWTDAPADVIDASAGPALRQVPLRVWGVRITAADIPAATSFINQAVGTALGIYHANRVGVSLTGAVPIQPIESTAVTCADLQTFLSPDGSIPDNAVWDATAVNIYLMPGGAGNLNGIWCWADGLGWLKNVIRLHVGGDYASLAHELGHLFGLYVPWGPANQHRGHVNEIKGFGRDNLMTGWVDIGSTVPRTRLSLGQVYRMHFDKRSWLAAAYGDCNCNPYTSPCGMLSRDTRPIDDAKGKLDAPSDICAPP